MTSSVGHRVAKLEQHHGLGGRTYVIAKDQTEPYDQAVALAGITPRAEDLVVVTNFFFDGLGVDGPDRRVLAVW